MVSGSTQSVAIDQTISLARPFVKWAGGKTQLLPELVARMPTHYNHYFEPFLGGGALFFALTPEPALISDVNPELINAYHIIQSDVESLIHHLQQHHYDKQYFYQMRHLDRTEDYHTWDPVHRASRFIFLNKTCYNGLYRVNSKGQFNTPFGHYKAPKILDADNLRACSLALQTAQIRWEPFEQVVHRARAGDFVYFDPPYAPLTATSCFTHYSKDGFDTQMQIKLRDICEQLDRQGVRFMVSNSAAPLILDLYQRFQVDFVEASRSINSKGNQRGKIKEGIITNYRG